MSFNQAQQEAVSHNEGPCLVLAGPGSGKTLTIVGRIQKLIQTYHVSPEEILVITFTKYAAVEMKNRFFSAMKGTRPAVTFGTFHGIYYGDVYKRQTQDRRQRSTDKDQRLQKQRSRSCLRS